MTIKRNVDLEFNLNPQELAEEFCNMGDNEQAIFFNEIANISDKWDKQFCFQLQAITNSKELTNEGRAIMESIGNYS